MRNMSIDGNDSLSAALVSETLGGAS
jgi:hypothetical protein